MSKKIISGAIIVTNDLRGTVFDPGAIVFDKEIIAVGPQEKILSLYSGLPNTNIRGGLITPGLVNLHHHFYSSMARGWNPGTAPKDFGEILEKIWWRLDETLRLDDIYYSAICGICESILAGVTTIVDHHSSQRTIRGSLDKIAEALIAIGARGSICFELSGRSGQKAIEEALSESMDAIEKFSGNRMIAPMVGLHASMTLSDDNLRQIAQVTEKCNAGYHFHLAESQIDQEKSIALSGKRATMRLAEFNLLNTKSLAVHGIYLEPDEIELLSDKGVSLVICPRSNQNNAVGVPHWWKYDGVDIGIGTDGIDSNLIQEAKAALYISRLTSGDPNFGFDDTKKILLESNPSIFGKIASTKIGAIAPGFAADFVQWNYISPTDISETNYWGHYLYGLANLRASSVWIDGVQVLANGNFTTIDFEAAMTQARRLARQLWKRV